MAHVLIVDDEAAFTEGMAEYLRVHGHSVSTAGKLEDARTLIDMQVPEVLLLDLMLPDGNGLELFNQFESQRPQSIVIMTGHTGVKGLIGTMTGDGVLYMKKPIEPREMLGIVNAVGESDSSIADHGSKHFGVLIGESGAMHSVYEQIRQVAPTDSTVFIQGQSGTGKELVAEALHRMSGRTGLFVPVNCGGLSRELVSTELFGHEKGSFTGATKRHLGFFERAKGGTLFLDEITEMPIEMQTHLLRVLETGNVLRVGGDREIAVNVRLVAASNRDPAQAVRAGVLREDLYYRLRVFPLVLPPLRDRVGDIALLAEHFLGELNRKHGSRRVFSAVALEHLESHSWPGNVRELRHGVHRAYIMANYDTVEVPQLFDIEPADKVEGLRAGRSIADVERDLILATLEHFRGDKKAAAASLGVSLKTLYNRIRDYG